jgi:hypothetical protein
MNEYLAKVNDYLLNKVRIPRPRSGFYPSEASCEIVNCYGHTEVVGRCLRKVYWSWHQEEETNSPSAQTERKFLLGNFVESAETDIMKRAGIYVANSVKFKSPYLQCSGEVDGVVNLPGLGIVGMEIKSIWNYNGTRGTIHPTRDKPFFPKIEHLMQTMCYLYHFTRENDFKIPIFKILYIDRGSGDAAEHTVRLTGEGYPIVNGDIFKKISIQGMKARIEEFFRYLNAKELPPRDYDWNYSDEKITKLADLKALNKADTASYEKGKPLAIADFGCRYCPFLDKCKEEGGDLRHEGQCNQYR